VADILSPEEIEALLTSLSGEEGEAQPQPGQPASTAQQRRDQSEALQLQRTSRSGRSYEIYDFRRPDKLSKEQLRTLHMLHETCARVASGSLAGFLRAPVQVELMSVEQVPYEEYLRSINQSVFAILSLAPLSGQAVLELEFALVFSMVDRMLGGPGRAINRSSLTEIEKPLVNQLIDKVTSSLKSAWEAIVIVNPRVEGMETSAQFVQIAPPTDIALMVLFEVKVGEQRGAMSLCVPYLVLKPIAGKLAGQKWAASAGRKKSPVQRRSMSLHVARTEVPVRIELGTATMSVAEFLSIEPGHLIRLEQKQTDDLLIQVKGAAKLLGRPVKAGRSMAVQVTGEYHD
jgi:flagellar motor switch protein FliM